MKRSPAAIAVYLEVGRKRAIAGALDWPGWCRSGPDADAALAALAAYGPRYERALQAAKIAFDAPADAGALEVVERLEGDATTDFGAPNVAPGHDARPFDAAALKELGALLEACWAALDKAASAAEGVPLRKGPRGGGRDLHGVLRHALEAERSYIGRLAVKAPPVNEDDPQSSTEGIRQAALDALGRAARGEMPKRGPRGGALWKPRYFVRRDAWHILDHAWELEDRST